MARDPQAVRVGANLRGLVAAIKAELCLEIAANLREACPVAANLREACPVDTGHARANILPSVDEPYAGEVEGGAAYDAAVVAVIGAPPEAELFVSNNVPYWGRLIGGSSSQAAPGWDLVAIDTAVQTVEQKHAGLSIDVSGSEVASARGAVGAAGLAAAYSPFGGEE